VKDAVEAVAAEARVLAGAAFRLATLTSLALDALGEVHLAQYREQLESQPSA
jgi:hypothetical protein